ncbi:TcpQ domain-containing protein [Photobacterium leiognathi]|uniref:TcpQ domain-containing protein n=1 Tax=Photobacterium leiognathi TaxID=553611 RepID=UPI0029814D5E|nr:TcpQ domain-containing protein [Photobacterium leiognathi]
MNKRHKIAVLLTSVLATACSQNSIVLHTPTGNIVPENTVKNDSYPLAENLSTMPVGGTFKPAQAQSLKSPSQVANNDSQKTLAKTTSLPKKANTFSATKSTPTAVVTNLPLEKPINTIKPVTTTSAPNSSLVKKPIKKSDTVKLYLPTSTAGLNEGMDRLTDYVRPKTIAYPVKPKTLNANLVDFISALAPNDWRIISGDGIENKRTPIVKSKDWQTALDTLTLIHPDVVIKKDSLNKTIKISKNPNLSTLKRFEKTWNIDKNLSLRENIEKWEKQTNWDVIWKAGEVNFVIEANAKFTGDFHGKKGVLETLLKGTIGSKNPIRPDWKHGNSVVLIVPRQAVAN